MVVDVRQPLSSGLIRSREFVFRLTGLVCPGTHISLRRFSSRPIAQGTCRIGRAPGATPSPYPHEGVEHQSARRDSKGRASSFPRLPPQHKRQFPQRHREAHREQDQRLHVVALLAARGQQEALRVSSSALMLIPFVRMRVRSCSWRSSNVAGSLSNPTRRETPAAIMRPGTNPCVQTTDESAIADHSGTPRGR